MNSRNLPHLPALDHLRLGAALLVMVFHLFHKFYGNWLPDPSHPWLAPIIEGHTGVGLFFTLSGYLFMSIAMHAGGQIDYGTFIRNRLLRIFPLFLMVYFVAISIGRDAFRPADLLYLMFSNLGQAPTSGSFITGAAWSISIEFTFYLVFPFLARFAVSEGPRYLLRLILLLLIFKIGAWFVTERSTHMYYSTLLGRMDQFLIGMLGAQLAVHRPLSSSLARWLLIISAVLLYAVLIWLDRDASYFAPRLNHPAWIGWGSVEATLWALVIISYSQAVLLKPTSQLSQLLCRGADLSFSLYLLHALVLELVFQLDQRLLLTAAWPASLRLLALGTLSVVCSLLLARLSYQSIERPFLALRRRYVAAASASTASVSLAAHAQE